MLPTDNDKVTVWYLEDGKIQSCVERLKDLAANLVPRLCQAAGISASEPELLMIECKKPCQLHHSHRKISENAFAYEIKNDLNGLMVIIFYNLSLSLIN
jgi:hypothetical protein